MLGELLSLVRTYAGNANLGENGSRESNPRVRGVGFVLRVQLRFLFRASEYGDGGCGGDVCGCVGLFLLWASGKVAKGDITSDTGGAG